MPLSHVNRLRKAVQQHLAGRRDSEGRSPLDLLVVEVLARPAAQSDWSRALISLISKTQERNGSWWQAIEFFVAMTKLCTQELAESLEQVVVRSEAPDAVGRASVYALLAECGRPVAAKTVWEDVDLKREAPLLWLDLLLLLIPEPTRRQEVVLDAVSRGEFGVPDFEIRLDDMRSIGGKNLGPWLWRLREAFPDYQRAEYDEIVRDAGFTISSFSPRLAGSRIAAPPKPHDLARAYSERIRTNSSSYPQYVHA